MSTLPPTPETDAAANESIVRVYETSQRLERERDAAYAKLFADDSDSIVGSGNCLTKTPNIQYHKRGCKYRLISERDAARAALKEIAWTALQDLAVQHMVGEIDDHSREGPDWECGYEACVKIARAALAAIPNPESGFQNPLP